MTIARVARPTSLPPATDRFCVVEASAGTGKTFFLEHRVVDLILAGAELGQILLVTFTDKAVAELRMRIRDLLDRLSRAEGDLAGSAESVWEIDDAARARLRASVTAFDHAPIFTIHGFCHRVLIEEAFNARRLLDQKQVTDEVAFDAAFSALVREQFAVALPDRDLLAAYLEWGKTVDHLRDLLLKCVRVDAPSQRRYHPLAVQAIGARMRTAFSADARERMLHEVPWKSVARYAGPWLDTVGRALAVAGEAPASLLGAIDDIRKNAPSLHKYLAGSPRHAEAAEALGDALKLMPLEAAIASELLPHVIARIHGDKAEKGQFDYDDMLRLVLAALNGDRGPDLAVRLRARTPWVMIDEFQDTDPVQWGIFRSVWMHEEARGLTIVGDPKQAIYGFRGADVATYLAARDELLRVGATRVTLDVNRRSTNALVDAVNEILIGQPLAPLLDKSITYETPVRASGDVTVAGDLSPPAGLLAPAPHAAPVPDGSVPAGSHAVAPDAPVPAGSHAALGADTPIPLRPRAATNPPIPLRPRAATSPPIPLRAHAPTAAGPRPPITVFELVGGTRDPQRHALATAIGVEIDRLRAAPPVWSSRGHAPAFSLGHVMVLTRSNKESVAIAAALRARGLPCALVESDRLFQTREAAELAAVLESIAMPRDRSARLRALRTRFFDVPWAELAQVVDAPDHHPLIARLFDWAALGAKREYETLFRRLVEDSRFAERALVLGGGERAHVNTWHIIELLLEEVARSRCDLAELATRLRRWINEHEDLDDDRDVQRAETDADAIRVLTIHKAKGLEAPYVFLFGCASQAPKSHVDVLRDATGRTLHVQATDEAIKAQIALESDAENQRLAYVALTRAQIRLYLPIYGEKVVHNTSTYWPIQRCLTPLVKRGYALLETLQIQVGGEEDPPAPTDALATFDAPRAPVVAELAALAPERRGLGMLSYTRLSRDLEAAAIEPGELPVAIDAAEFDADQGNVTDEVLVLAPDELPGGSDAGSYLHALFEHADLDTLRAAPTSDAWRQDPIVAALLVDQAREWNIGRQYIAHAARVVHATLCAPLPLTDGNALPPLVHASALARELEFTYPVPGVSPPRALVKGFIDALVAYEDELWVLDYKSDLLRGADLAAAAKRHVEEHYMVQARLYALAAERMRGRRKFAGLLYTFVRYNLTVPLRIEETTLGEWSNWLATLRTEGNPGGTPHRPTPGAAPPATPGAAR